MILLQVSLSQPEKVVNEKVGREVLFKKIELLKISTKSNTFERVHIER